MKRCRVSCLGLSIFSSCNIFKERSVFRKYVTCNGVDLYSYKGMQVAILLLLFVSDLAFSEDSQLPPTIFGASVVSYSAGGGVSGIYKDPAKAVGAPDYDGSDNPLRFVALGNGGQIVLKMEGDGIFASGNPGSDLSVLEVGAVVGEPVAVAVSKDGSMWVNVGSTSASPNIDIDAYAGIQAGEYYPYVRLIDSNQNLSKSPTAGADIDAVEAPNRGTKEQLGKARQACAGNPINLALGNKYQGEQDYVGSGAFPLSFSRFYNSLDGVWRHNFSARLIVRSSSITLIHDDGREVYYALLNGLATPVATELGSLVKSGNTWIYTGVDNARLVFNSVGRLTSITNSVGLKRVLTYPAGKVTVTDGAGNQLSFTEDKNLQPLTLAVNGLSVSYIYTQGKGLTKVSRTRAGQAEVRLYHYEDAHNARLLTGITDERGVRYASWTYSEQGRAISSEHADGAERVEVAYNADGSTTVTNELGKRTQYNFTTIGNVRYLASVEGEPSANCPASNSTYTYNDRGQVLTKTDAKGFITTYAYNDRGLETSRTEASGTPQARTTTTTWHTTFNLPLTVTEGVQVTTYTYDAQGRQTSRTQSAL